MAQNREDGRLDIAAETGDFYCYEKDGMQRAIHHLRDNDEMTTDSVLVGNLIGQFIPA